MTIKNTFLLIFISFSLSFLLIPQASARSVGTIKIQRSIASSRIPSHIKKKALARRDLIRRYKRLSTRQKFKLITSMVRTMAALELANSRREGRRGTTSYNDSLFHPFLSLFITQAYAQSSGNRVCFLGGHLVDNTTDGTCNWDAARDAHKKCKLSNGNDGIQCNSALFPSNPCVRDFKDPQVENIRNYSSTQACAYADAYKYQKFLNSSGLDHPKDAVIEEFDNKLKNSSLWSSSDPEDWVKKRNSILSEAGSEAKGKYESLLANHTVNGEAAVITELQNIQRQCAADNINSFEKKHCRAFKTDLHQLNLNYDHNTAPTTLTSTSGIDDSDSASEQTTSESAPVPVPVPVPAAESPPTAEPAPVPAAESPSTAEPAPAATAATAATAEPATAEPATAGKEDDPAEPEEDTDPSENDDDCFDFHELPGEHFCQVRVAATSDTEKKGHLVVRIEGEDANREAVVYHLDNEKKKYCKNSDFQKENYNPARETSSNLSYPDHSSCYPINNMRFSNSAKFSYEQATIRITRKKGYSNMCNLSVDGLTKNNFSLVGPLDNSSKQSNFIPGIRVQCKASDDLRSRIDDIDDEVHRNENKATHTYEGCQKWKEELNAPTTGHNCVDSDVVALKNATNYLQYQGNCQEPNITDPIKHLKIKECDPNRSDGTCVSNNTESLSDWLENNESFGDKTYRIFEEGGEGDVGKRIDFKGTDNYTISDWIYEEGESEDQKSNIYGFYGITTHLCSNRSPAPSPAETTGTGID